MDTYDVPDLGLMRLNDGRVQGPLGEANQYGLFVAMFLPILISKFFLEHGPWRLFFGVGSAVGFWVLLLTVSRGAFVSLFLGSLFSAFVFRRQISTVVLKRTAVVGVLAIAGASFLLGDQFRDLIFERTVEAIESGDSYELTSGRVWLWTKVLNLMFNEPWSILTGYGWFTFREIMDIAPHNVYLNYLFELGIIGLLLFISLLGSILMLARKAVAENPADKYIVPGLIGFFFGFAVLMIGIFAVDLALPWYFVWAYVGIAMREVMLLESESMSKRVGGQAERRRDALSEPPHGNPYSVRSVGETSAGTSRVSP
jgi:O-antigen ligase